MILCANRQFKKKLSWEFLLQKLAYLLYKAADDGDVDPHDVSKILKISRAEASFTMDTSCELSSKASGIMMAFW